MVKYILSGLSSILLFLSSCDEGTIYPEEVNTETGCNATVEVVFADLKAWPKKNFLTLSAFGDDPGKPIVSKRIGRPTVEGKPMTLKLHNIRPETKTLEFAVVSNGQKVVYSYCSFPINPQDKETYIDAGILELGSYTRIQSQVFDNNCLSCHGGSSSTPAGNLDLRHDVSYKSLVNVKAPVSPDGKNYVTPGDLQNSFLLDILEEHPIHRDIFNSSGKKEILGLIEGWILGGAKNN
ncbi:MAG: hypothetical protein SOR57_07440 [Parabacteroides sp.]|nr:hypothetical protein [Parabacteroides sp.]